MIYAIPTDTCYGLASLLSDEAGFHRIYMMKGRDFDKPLAILVRNYHELRAYTDITDEQLLFLREYPYPFTLLATPSKKFTYPAYMDRNRYAKIAFRVAEQCIPESVREEIPYPVFLTSANKSGGNEAYSGDEVVGIFSVWIDDMKILDGETGKGKSSNIFQFLDGTTKMEFLRKNYE